MLKNRKGKYNNTKLNQLCSLVLVQTDIVLENHSFFFDPIILEDDPIQDMPSPSSKPKLKAKKIVTIFCLQLDQLLIKRHENISDIKEHFRDFISPQNTTFLETARRIHTEGFLQRVIDKEISERFDQNDFEDVNIFIWNTYDTDAHEGNFRVYVKEVDALGNEIYQETDSHSN